MTAHVVPQEPAHVATRIAQLSHLPMENLWALWDSYFDERPHHHHRTWLESRLAYKIQEQVFGGLKPSLRRKLEQIGETGILPSRLQRDADRLLPGSVLTRIYDDVEHRVTVISTNAFEYNGLRFKSLSAVARAITGMSWSGPLFFGLKARQKREIP